MLSSRNYFLVFTEKSLTEREGHTFPYLFYFRYQQLFCFPGCLTMPGKAAPSPLGSMLVVALLLALVMLNT